MSFLIKNQKLLNTICTVLEIIDVIINLSFNLLSKDEFNIFDKHNIFTFIVLAILIIVHIFFHLLIKNNTAKGEKRYLQKAFKENGGYDKAVDEMKVCLETHDFKSFKEVVKAIKYIER